SAAPHPPTSTLSPYTTLFRSRRTHGHGVFSDGDSNTQCRTQLHTHCFHSTVQLFILALMTSGTHPVSGQFDVREFFNAGSRDIRSEEHTSELQSRENLVCRLL